MLTTNNTSAYSYDLTAQFNNISGNNRKAGLSVRCVSTQSSAVKNIKADELQISVVGNLLSFENLTGFANVQIFDVSGRTVETRHATSLQETIDISDLPAGIYIVKVGGKTAKFVKK